MQSTIVLVALVFTLVTLDLLLWAVFLAIGLRWARVQGVTRRKILIATGVAFLVALALKFAFIAAYDSPAEQPLLSMVLQLGLLIAVRLAVIRQVFRSTVWQAVRAYLTTLIPSLLVGLVAGFLVIPHVAEAFVLTSSPMAPTLLGPSVQSVCAECGEPCYASPDINNPGMYFPGGRTMICARFHTLPVGDVNETIHAPDRILAAKYLSPRRWDAVVFRPPFEPETHYVMRIVGLPGETIVIRDGIVIADGTPLEPPQELAGITFTPDPPGHELTLDPVWGTDENPATLAAGEYFVLGDNTTRSRDSRLWPENATGHPPYALPAENIEGVVTHIYWPPSRVRIIR